MKIVKEELDNSIINNWESKQIKMSFNEFTKILDDFNITYSEGDKESWNNGFVYLNYNDFTFGNISLQIHISGTNTNKLDIEWMADDDDTEDRINFADGGEVIDNDSSAFSNFISGMFDDVRHKYNLGRRRRR